MGALMVELESQFADKVESPDTLFAKRGGSRGRDAALWGNTRSTLGRPNAS